MIGFYKTLTLNGLRSLFNNEILILVVTHQKSYRQIDRICSVIKEKFSSSYEYAGNVVSHIGTSSYEIDHSKERLSSYYDNVKKNNLMMSEIFSPDQTPMSWLEDDINHIWDPGIKLESLHGKEMFAGIIRIIHQGSAIHAHQDLVGWSNPKAKNAQDIQGQFGVNYFLQVPKEGGRLLLWNMHLDKKEFHAQSEGDFCIPISKLPPPDFIVKPENGMLILLNSTKLHAIETSIDGDRIASSCFIAYRGEDQPLTYWT